MSIVTNEYGISGDCCLSATDSHDASRLCTCLFLAPATLLLPHSTAKSSDVLSNSTLTATDWGSRGTLHPSHTLRQSVWRHPARRPLPRPRQRQRSHRLWHTSGTYLTI